MKIKKEVHVYMKKKKYEAPKAEVTVIATKDVILASGTLSTFSSEKLLSMGKILDIE